MKIRSLINIHLKWSANMVNSEMSRKMFTTIVSSIVLYLGAVSFCIISAGVGFWEHFNLLLVIVCGSWLLSSSIGFSWVRVRLELTFLGPHPDGRIYWWHTVFATLATVVLGPIGTIWYLCTIEIV